jgi:2-keto-3-deoxy-L-rhamnonate aldolase RhmA
MTDLAQRLRKREPIVGSFVIELPARGTVEAYASAGFDFLILDLEHSATDVERLSFLIACCRAGAIGCVVRIRAGGLADLTRVLDMHPDGVMVPGISNADEATDVVRLSRFHPLGARGLAPLGRHRLENEGALAAIDANTAIIVQIEGRSAVDNAASIASVQGIDGVFVGPYDLSQALGIPGRLDDERLLEVGGQVARDVLPQAALGVYVNDASAADAWQALGASFYAHSTDGQMLLRAVSAARGQWHGAEIDK